VCKTLNETHKEWLERMRSISVTTQHVKTSVVDGKKQTVTKDPGGLVVQSEHADGRVDATVKPETVRYGARAHSTGKKRGEVAEITRKAP